MTRLAVFVTLWCAPVLAEGLVLTDALHHLRSGEAREWSEFPEKAESNGLELSFESAANEDEWTLSLRQQDVRRNWRVLLNDDVLGKLVLDEGDQFLQLPVPSGMVRRGSNRLRIECTAGPRDPSDDIRVGEIELQRAPAASVVGECALRIRVVDADIREGTPARITITNPAGALCPVATEDARLAVRTGCVYTPDGTAVLTVPAGGYVVTAGRGFEYSLARREITLKAGESADMDVEIRRVAPTDGYVACDTHIHTRTYSGHGDATIAERMVTIAGEGIELPIATDHDVLIDYEPFARDTGVRRFFTPVIGDEVTTKQGHFNVFPVERGAQPPDPDLASWAKTFDAIEATPGVRVVILNHARDLHRGTRPFGPKLYNAVAGENLAGWPMRFNAMEVINSGATQTAPLQLMHDWMAQLNAGRRVTPIGGSDSHDVNRYIVGQGRTYIRADDRDPGQIDVAAAVQSLVEGRVLVSYGLMAEIVVEGEHHSGDLAAVNREQPGEELRVSVRVLGPEWAAPRRVLLYANGQLLREEELPSSPQSPGVWYTRDWRLKRPRHDLFLAAVAIGDGVDDAFWRTAKPYQPTSPHWEPHTLGCSGAVFVDADGDGAFTSARGYAAEVLRQAGDDPAAIAGRLTAFDAAVSAQAAHLFRVAGGDLDALAAAVEELGAGPALSGVREYQQAWRDNQVARLE